MSDDEKPPASPWSSSTPVSGLLELVDTVVLQEHLTGLTDAVVLWATRDATAHDQVGVREAANRAMEKADAILQSAHRLRAELVDQIRRYDDDRGMYWKGQRCTCPRPLPPGWTYAPVDPCPVHFGHLRTGS